MFKLPSVWAFLFMLSLITLLLTHLISIWTDLILILLPCNLNAHNHCNYAAEGTAPPRREDLNLGLPGKGAFGGHTAPRSWQLRGAHVPRPQPCSQRHGYFRLHLRDEPKVPSQAPWNKEFELGAGKQPSTPSAPSTLGCKDLAWDSAGDSLAACSCMPPTTE